MARRTDDDKFSQPDVNLAGIGLQGPRPDSRDISTARPQFDGSGNPIGFGWKESDGSVTLIGGQRYAPIAGPYRDGYRYAPEAQPPNSIAENPMPTAPPSGNGSGGALPMAVKRLAAAGGSAALGRMLGGNTNPGSAAANLPPEFQQLLALAMRRMADQEPLFQAVNAQAMGGLPTAYQRG